MGAKQVQRAEGVAGGGLDAISGKGEARRVPLGLRYHRKDTSEPGLTLVREAIQRRLRESGIPRVFESQAARRWSTRTTQIDAAPELYLHGLSESSLTTIAWWPMPACCWERTHRYRRHLWPAVELQVERSPCPIGAAPGPWMNLGTRCCTCGSIPSYVRRSA